MVRASWLRAVMPPRRPGSSSFPRRSTPCIAFALVLASCTTDSGHAPSTAVSGGPTASAPTASSSAAAADSKNDEGTVATSAPEDTTSPTQDRSTTTAPATARYAYGSFWQDFTDAKRNRVLKTRVHFPAEGVPLNAGTSKAKGSFPLVLMAHGYNLPAGGYETILTRIAASGYIVAAPAFPHTSQETGDGNRSDIVNQPADLSFVADALTELARTPDSPIPSIKDPDRIAILGHSDGGLTATAIAYDAQFHDPRVVATVVMTGGIALFPGTFFTAPPFAPMLAIHARADETNGYGASVNLFNRVPSPTPKYLVTIEGGSHLGPYMFDTAMPEVGQIIADFLDAYVLGTTGAADRLVHDASAPGRISVQSG